MKDLNSHCGVFCFLYATEDVPDRVFTYPSDADAIKIWPAIRLINVNGLIEPERPEKDDAYAFESRSSPFWSGVRFSNRVRVYFTRL